MEKKKIAELEKCYAVAPLRYQGRDCFLAAAEKKDRCLLFTADGTLLDTVWDGPGGVMSIEQIPGSDGVFLATQKFYSPNDSASARIVIASPAEGGWKVKPFYELPFVHRFGILHGGDGQDYLIAATIKSAHAYKDDWTCPGRIWVGALPEDPLHVDAEHPFTMTPVKSALYRNHGFFKEAGGQSALFGTDNGVFRVTAPAKCGEEWTVEQLLDTPVSDMTMVDLDGDGKEEMLVYAPFHGENCAVYHEQNGAYVPVWKCDHPLPFLHAIWGGTLQGIPTALIGHRGGERDLLMLRWQNGTYVLSVLDHDVGPANVMVLHQADGEAVISANRETNEVVYLKFS